jgi:hypothetical protein
MLERKDMRKRFVFYFLVSLFLVGLLSGAIPVTYALSDGVYYNSGSNLLTVVGVNPWTGENWNFWDCWNASYMNGWNVIFRQEQNQFYISCKITIGDGSTNTLFTDSSKQIVFADGIINANGEYWMEFVRPCVITFGELNDAETKSTKNGCSFLFLETTYYGYFATYSTALTTGYGYFYSCTFSSVDVEVLVRAQFRGEFQCFNCQFLGKGKSGAHLTTVPDGSDIFNLVATGTSAGIRTPSGAVDHLIALSCSKGVWFQNGAQTVKNVYGRGCDYAFRMEADPYDCYIINGDFDLWHISWVSSTGKMFRQYEFDLTVLNGEITDFVENANVTLTKNDAQIFSLLTNSSGQIPTQVVTYGYYDQSHGDSIQDGSYPFILTVTHPDWSTYTSRFYVTEKTNLIISMQENDTIQYLVVALILGAVVGGVVVALLSSKR